MKKKELFPCTKFLLADIPAEALGVSPKIATAAQETKEQLYDEVTKQAEKLAKVTKLLKKGIVWNSYPSFFLSGSDLKELCELLRIEKDDKATL